MSPARAVSPPVTSTFMLMRLLTEPAKIPVDRIDIPETRKLWRPEARCSAGALAPLIEQIRTVGWVHAIIVRPSGTDRYDLIDGERRLKAERSEGQTWIDAVVVHADDGVAAAITLLCTLPPAELPAIHSARLVKWVRGFDLENGGSGTNAVVASYLRRDPSTVSRLRTIDDGLPAQVLAEIGLTDDDLEEVGATTLHWLATLESSAKRETLCQLREAKEGGGNLAAHARQLATTRRSKARRGRRAKPFRVTDRSDGRFACSVTTRPLIGEHARELLERIKPFLRETADGAGIASLDDFLGFRRMDERPHRAQRTKGRISLIAHDLQVAIAAKWRSISVTIQHLKDTALACRWLAQFNPDPARAS